MKAKINKATSIKHRAHHHARALLVPHKGNQYRPHLIRRYGLLAIAALIGFMQISYNLATSGLVLGESSTVNVREVIADTNNVRLQNDTPALVVSEELNMAAALKAKDMFAKQYWAHESPDGVKPWVWFDHVGYSYTAAGENLAKNFSTSSATVTAWMNSPEHRKNLLDDRFTEVGVAVLRDDLNGEPTTIIVALYGSPVISEVAGATSNNAAMTLASSATLSPIARIGVALQSMTPATIASLALMMVAFIVAISAHAYRQRMPKPIQRTWRLHHGAIKANGIGAMMLLVVWLYSGGQI